jgi:hypothetical protein
MSVETRHPSTIPGAVQESLRRELDSGGLIEFESSPTGWLTQAGEMRVKDYRAYYWTAQPECESCDGSGRVPSEKRPGGTVKCQPCNGSGETKRQRVMSVSSVLDMILPKPGLPPWAEKQGIEGAIKAVRLGEIDPYTIAPGEATERVRGLRLGADRARDDAADRGLNVHDLLREYMETGNAPSRDRVLPEHAGYHQALCRFLLKTNLEPLLVEELVCDPSNGYAGRSDLVAMADGFRIRYDAKTNEKGQIWPGAHVQDALYERAGIASGDDPCDLLKIVVFAANGEYREMACSATEQTIDAALEWCRYVRPLNSVCESANRVEREARR